MKRMQSGELEVLGFIVGAILVIAFIVGWIIFSLNWSNNHHQVTLTVNKSERVTQNCGKGVCSKYLIYTQQGVYEDTDDWVNSKFNSSDLYNQIESGKTYTCDSVGWRDEIFSWYPNLLRCEEVKR